MYRATITDLPRNQFIITFVSINILLRWLLELILERAVVNLINTWVITVFRTLIMLGANGHLFTMTETISTSTILIHNTLFATLIVLGRTSIVFVSNWIKGFQSNELHLILLFEVFNEFFGRNLLQR